MSGVGMAAGTGDDHAAWRPDAAGPDGEERLLVARARRDPAAFGPLYERYLPDIYRYSLFRVGRREAAEDVTSQTFIKALASLGAYRGGSFRSWLFTIAHRTAIDHLRARRPDVAIDVAGEIADIDPTPESVAVASDEQRHLFALLAGLPPDQRRVVEIRLAGLNDREIADVLGESHTAIRTRQSRAMARLRTLARTTGWTAAREETSS